MPPKELYMAKTLKDLNAQIKEIKGSNGKQLVNSLPKIYQAAEDALREGDEEKGYLLFMRFLEVFKEIGKTPEYSKDPAYFKKLMSPERAGEVFKKVETVQKSLAARYSLMAEARQVDRKLKEDEMKDAVKQTQAIKDRSIKSNSAQPSLVPGTNGVTSLIKPKDIKENGVIANQNVTAAQLKQLTDQKSTRFLLIDCRFHDDFISAHFIHPNCISIPSEILEAGMSASKISEALKKSYPGSFLEWNRRSEFDRVILYDWTSSFDNMQDPMSILYTAMTKWDPSTNYKSVPAVLQGGMKHMYYSYPILINKPLKIKEDQRKRTEILKKEVEEEFKYPSLDDNEDVAKPHNNLNSTNTTKIIDDLSKLSLHPKNSVNNNISVSIDRSTKPKTSTAKISNDNRINPEEELPTTNGIVNGISSSRITTSDPVEGKKAALELAYEDAIRSNRGAVSLEEELKELQLKALQSRNEVLMDALKSKEKDLEDLEKQMINKDENLKLLQTELTTAIEQGAKAKSTLPLVRVKVDANLQDKLREKEKLDAYVKQLREERKKREQEKTSDLKLPSISSPQFLSKPRVSNSTTTVLPSINSYGGDPAKGHGITSEPIPIKQQPKPSNSSAGLLRPMSQDASPVTFQKLKEETSESPRSGLLKRSHSHPNIAQSLNEDDISTPSGSVPSQTPNFNRSLKPVGGRGYTPETYTPTRTREFHAVNSTEKHRTGLKNLGNTCYMNSIVQCLYHLPGLVEFFIRGESSKILPTTKDRVLTKGDITSEMGAVVSEMNKGHRSIEIRCLKNVVGKYHSNFAGNDQQDSHEFLTFLLDWLHEELNTRKKSPLKEQKNDDLSDEVAASRAWDDFLSSNCSKVIDLFCGQQRSCVRCQMCGKESVTFENFFNLSVPIPPTNRKVDIQQCIDLYTSEEEVVGWNCVHCKGKGKARKKIDLWKLPPNLIIHLQRFFFDGWWKKRFTEVDFPVENFDLTQKVKSRPKSTDQRSPRYNYELMGVSNHYGTMEGGHYTAYCRKGQYWAKFDDVDVSQLNSRDVVTSTAYILFYSNNSP